MAEAVPGIRQVEVQEPRPRDVGVLEAVAELGAQSLAEALGDRPRLVAQTGASSIAALVEKSPNSAFFGRSSVASTSGPPSDAAALRSAARRSSIGSVSLTPCTLRRSSVVVGLAREDLVPAVDLLQQDDARELVGKRHRAERKASCRRRPSRGPWGRRR